MERRILVTGGTGQLGIELTPRLAQLGKVFAPTRQDLDLTSEDAVAGVAALKPTHVVHAAAATDVERCEEDPAWARAVNVEGTRRIAEACREVGAWLLYISTDYVFDGAKQSPYLESDTPRPLNTYGWSKLAGEVQVRTLALRWAIVRTAWLYGHVGRSFVTAILGRLRAGGPLAVVTDEVGSPTYAGDLAEAIAPLLTREARGTFHLTNSGACSRHEFAQAIARQVGGDRTEVVPITSANLGLRARRPAYSVLANAAWTALGLPSLRPWQVALHDRLVRDPGVTCGVVMLHRGHSSAASHGKPEW